jgi:hypothetical protein
METKEGDIQFVQVEISGYERSSTEFLEDHDSKKVRATGTYQITSNNGPDSFEMIYYPESDEFQIQEAVEFVEGYLQKFF